MSGAVRVFYHVAISKDHMARYSPEAASLEEIAEWWPDRTVTALISQEDATLGCILCLQPRRSPGLLVSAYGERDKPVCASCTEVIGRAWQAAAFEVVETGYRRRYPNGVAGCLHDDKRMAGTLDEVTEREAEASKLVSVTTRRRRKP